MPPLETPPPDAPRPDGGWWRSLDEFHDTPAFREALEREFPSQASAWDDPVGRRRFLQLMGASLALAGLTGCPDPPVDHIVPYVRQPEEIIPGRPLFYATTFTLGGRALGVLAESHMGRPTKIEGNPDHPASRGATDAFAQASILSLYDPKRSQTITRDGRIATWPAFLAALAGAMTDQRAKKGAGLRLLTGDITSPTLLAQIDALRTAYPEMRHHVHEPVSAASAREGARLAFGRALDVHYRLDRADVILALDADVLRTPRHARDYAARRPKNRLYSVESALTITGAKADHRRRMRSCEIDAYARTILTSEDAWTAAMARDLKRNGIVIAGEHQPAAVHATALAINQAIGAIGTRAILTEPLSPVAPGLDELAADLDAGRVDLLVILGADPAFTAPAFAKKIARAALSVVLGTHEDETSKLCTWHVPEAHYLETWGDARAFDGTVSFIQPLVAPLYGGRSAHEILAALAGQAGRTPHEIVRAQWKSLSDADWKRALHDGLLRNTALAAQSVGRASTELPPPRPAVAFEVVFRPDPTLWDGRFRHNNWLQELPKPITHLAWDNAALISPATAKRLNVRNEDVVAIGDARVPVWIQPGHADDSLTLHLGDNVAPEPGSADIVGAMPKPTGARRRLACTQLHHTMDGRNLVPEKPEEHPKDEHSLYPPHPMEGPQWGMVIDLGACVGCNACITACQSENNIPIVGRDEVINGREMQWIRVDAYHRGDEAAPETVFQPVPCMHCENAPCEVVCPVNATVHSKDGLNDMVYNRCVGTRYCSNNCPYKVRRFNFLQYADTSVAQVRWMRNPDVTVRSRGVMEKCTYCVQRISAARIDAKKRDGEIDDGAIVTACQQVCPANAITFGDVSDESSRVSQLRTSKRHYALLAELNTRPRTTYLAPERNPNPEIRS